MLLRFGEMTFDGGSPLLLRGDAPVHLSPKAFRLLEVLLEERPKALSKADLQETSGRTSSCRKPNWRSASEN